MAPIGTCAERTGGRDAADGSTTGSAYPDAKRARARPSGSLPQLRLFAAAPAQNELEAAGCREDDASADEEEHRRDDLTHANNAPPVLHSGDDGATTTVYVRVETAVHAQPARRGGMLPCEGDVGGIETPHYGTDRGGAREVQRVTTHKASAIVPVLMRAREEVRRGRGGTVG